MGHFSGGPTVIHFICKYCLGWVTCASFWYSPSASSAQPCHESSNASSCKGCEHWPKNTKTHWNHAEMARYAKNTPWKKQNKETRYAIILYFIAILNNDRAKIPIQTLIIFQCVKQSTRFLRISTFQQKNNQIWSFNAKLGEKFGKRPF